MTRSLQYFGSVSEAGKLVLESKQSFVNDLKMFSGCKVVLSLRVQEKSLSNAQRRYYRGVIIPLLIECLVDLGHERWEATPAQVHNVLWSHFGRFNMISIDEIDDLPAQLFSEYIGSIQRFCAMYMGVILPDPQ